MLRQTAKQRFLSRVFFYSSVIALLWVMEKVADAQRAAVPEPPVHGFVAAVPHGD